jgi:hypothetical protein
MGGLQDGMRPQPGAVPVRARRLVETPLTDGGDGSTR